MAFFRFCQYVVSKPTIPFIDLYDLYIFRAIGHVLQGREMILTELNWVDLSLLRFTNPPHAIAWP
jgi:hypothetical protein